MYDFSDVLKFIDSHKCFEHFGYGDAFFIHKWFFSDYNTLKAVTPKYKSVIEALNHNKCEIIEIENFHINVILRTNNIKESYKHYARVFLKIKQFYELSKDSRGLDIINMVIFGYFSYISGHLFTHNTLVYDSLMETINHIQNNLNKISPEIILEDNRLVMYDSSDSVHLMVKEYFKDNWQHVKLETWEYSDKKYGNIKTKTN